METDTITPSVMRYSDQYPMSAPVMDLNYSVCIPSNGGSFAQNQEYVRKLTCITIINDGFKGGLFYILNGSGEKFFPPQKKGDIIVFPSSTLHGCETVYEGQRHAVVAWMNGRQVV